MHRKQSYAHVHLGALGAALALSQARVASATPSADEPIGEKVTTENSRHMPETEPQPIESRQVRRARERRQRKST